MSWAAWEQWYNFIYNYYVYLEEICYLKRVLAQQTEIIISLHRLFPHWVHRA